MMKKKATLLIQQLEAVYTMDPKPVTVKYQAFIAIYHDRILKIGSGLGKEFIDKDTKIIDGRNHIALPGFIDIDVESELLKKHTYDTAQRLQTMSGIFLRHGTMLIHSKQAAETLKEQLKHPSMIDIHTQSCKIQPEIVYPLIKKARASKHFCISCGYDNSACLDQWLCAKLFLKNHPHIKETKALAACTLNPAKALGLDDYGVLKAGAKANILLFHGKELSQVMTRFYGDELIHVIKDGIRFYPNPII